MNSICFYSHEISDEEIINFTDAKRLGHLNTHLRAKVGEKVKVTILDSGLFQAKIVDLSHEHCKMQLENKIDSNDSWFDLLIGLSRPQTIKKVLEHTTTFGVNSVTISRNKL